MKSSTSSRLSTWSLLALLLLQYTPAAGRISDSFLSLAVSNGLRSRPSGDAVVEFDEFGGLPQLENTYRAIAKASTVVAIRTVNGSLLSYTVKDFSSLQVPVGAQSLNSLTNPHQYMLITGLAGDARCVIRHAKQLALNYTAAFDTAPTGRYIAHEVGKFLQEFTVRGGIRPLACHTFIADSTYEKSLYEIDAAGNVAQIWAGVAGCNMGTGRGILESRLNGSAISSMQEATEIAESILQCGSSDRNKLLDNGVEGLVSGVGDCYALGSDGGPFRTVHFALYDQE